MLRKIFLIAMFLLLSCSLAYADFGDKATLGGQDSSGNYSWRVTSDDDLIPGTTAQNDIGTTAKAVNEIHATTIYVTDAMVTQGKIAAVTYTQTAALARTVSLDYGIMHFVTSGNNDITVPDGTYAGQTIMIDITTDSGFARVIPTTKTGYTIINMDAVLDTVTLKWVSASIGWILTGQFGVTLD